MLYKPCTHAWYSSQTPTGPIPEKAEIVIVGGGIIGTLAAVFLANRIPGNSICIIEKDLTVSQAHTMLLTTFLSL